MIPDAASPTEELPTVSALPRMEAGKVLDATIGASFHHGLFTAVWALFTEVIVDALAHTYLQISAARPRTPAR